MTNRHMYKISHKEEACLEIYNFCYIKKNIQQHAY